MASKFSKEFGIEFKKHVVFCISKDLAKILGVSEIVTKQNKKWVVKYVVPDLEDELYKWFVEACSNKMVITN